jgi:hypothetical protein
MLRNCTLPSHKVHITAKTPGKQLPAEIFKKGIVALNQNPKPDNSNSLSLSVGHNQTVHERAALRKKKTKSGESSFAVALCDVFCSVSSLMQLSNY